MDPSSEIPPDVLNSLNSDSQIWKTVEHLYTPSTSTGKTSHIMPLESNTNGEQDHVRKEDLHLPSSAVRQLVGEIQSINSSIQLLCSRIKECNEHLLENKVAIETLSKNPNHATLSDKEIIDILNSLIESNDIILDEKKNVNSELFEIKEALVSISVKLPPSFYVEAKVIDTLGLLNTSIESIDTVQKEQYRLFVEMKGLSVAIKLKLHVASSEIKDLIYALQKQNESTEQIYIQESLIFILDMIDISLDIIFEHVQSALTRLPNVLNICVPI